MGLLNATPSYSQFDPSISIDIFNIHEIPNVLDVPNVPDVLNIPDIPNIIYMSAYGSKKVLKLLTFRLFSTFLSFLTVMTFLPLIKFPPSFK